MNPELGSVAFKATRSTLQSHQGAFGDGGCEFRFLKYQRLDASHSKPPNVYIEHCMKRKIVPITGPDTKSQRRDRTFPDDPPERKVANTKLNSVALRKGQRKSFDRGLTRVLVVLLLSGPAKRQAR